MFLHWAEVTEAFHPWNSLISITGRKTEQAGDLHMACILLPLPLIQQVVYKMHKKQTNKYGK